MAEWWQPTFQTTIDAYYQGDITAGMHACERLLSLDMLPPNIEQQTRRNLAFYLPTLRELGLLRATRRIVFPVPDDWTLFNPSIAAGPDHGQLTAIVRSANYTVSPTMDYTVHAADGLYRTTNYLLTLSLDLEPLTIQEIDDRAIRADPPRFLVTGFEDCRLVRHRDAWFATATARDQNAQGICQVAFFRLDGAVASDLHLLNSADDGRHEKNWMPVAPGDDTSTLRVIYRCSPTVILRVDEYAGAVTPDISHPGPPLAREFSGGTQAIPVDGGHLALVHESATFDDRGRVYSHRFVWFDADWRLARLSPPFLLRERGVEFAAGLTQQGDDLIISHGLWDREAWLSTVPLSAVLSLLAPPLDPGQIAAEMRDSLEITPAPVPTPAITYHPSSIPHSPTIVSTTLSGNNREIIGDALRSVVDWVDWCLLIDTGIDDDTIEVARAIAGDKLIVRHFPWQDDFAAARNFALQAAHELGADWTVTLDTDERIDIGAVDVRGALATTAAASLHVVQGNGTYGKERFFRLPARGRYVGPTHEAFIREGDGNGSGSETLGGVTFDELGKSVEQYRQKAERDIAILTRHTAAHPDDPRWFYYLGDSYAGLERHEEAIAAFRACAARKGWDEEGAWAMYRAAECLIKLGRAEDAIEACATGMARHAGLAELPWLAAYASWQAGRSAQAAYWARQSIAMGHYAGAGASVPRIGFRHPPALWEGPFDVLRFALRALGDEAGADEAERYFAEALNQREAHEMT